MGDVTRELAPGSVDVRLRGLDPEFVVTAPPAPEPVREEREAVVAPVVAAAPAGEADDGTMVRINLRLPAHLKGRAESAAAAEGLSVNAWLVRAVSVSLDGGGARAHRAAARTRAVAASPAGSAEPARSVADTTSPADRRSGRRH